MDFVPSRTISLWSCSFIPCVHIMPATTESIVAQRVRAFFVIFTISEEQPWTKAVFACPSCYITHFYQLFPLLLLSHIPVTHSPPASFAPYLPITKLGPPLITKQLHVARQNVHHNHLQDLPVLAPRAHLPCRPLLKSHLHSHPLLQPRMHTASANR